MANKVVTSEIEPSPFASKYTLTVAPVTVGSILSSIVTVIVSETVLPEGSAAVTTTVFAPKSLQLNDDLLYEIVAEQLSVALPEVKVATPFASNDRVTSETVRTGSSVS